MLDHRSGVRRRRATVSQRIHPHALLLWGLALVWLLRVTLFVRRRAGTEYSSVDTAATLQILIVFVTFLALFATPRSREAFARMFKTPIGWLLAYCAVGVVSFVWSQNPMYSVYRAFEYGVMFSAVFVALSYSRDFAHAERTAFVFILLALAFDLIFFTARMAGSLTSLSSWHTNSYSISAGILFCYCLGEYLRSAGTRRKTMLWISLIAVALVALGTSSGSWIAVGGGTLAVAILTRSGKLIFAALAFATGEWLLSTLVGDLDVVREVVFHGKSEGTIEGMSGRRSMWERLFNLWLAQPALGYGFGVTPSGASDPHNAYLAVLLGTGLVGASLVVAFLVFMGARVLRTVSAAAPGSTGSAGALAFLLVNSVSTTPIFDEWERASIAVAVLIAFFCQYVSAKSGSVKKTRNRFVRQ